MTSKDLSRESIVPEQEDEDTQAQSIAAEAQEADRHTPGDSEKAHGGLEDIDAPDLIDRMNQMESSGQIDMGAFDGEESMDDLGNKYGAQNAIDPEFAEDDS